MAISRVLNAIWAQIASRGMLIKISTNPYDPSPGTLVGNGASPGGNVGNNLGIQALTGPTPFVEINHDGVAVNDDGTIAVPVATTLAGIGNLNPTALDENSGAYHVVRQYGDLYFFNDGNIIQWGGNGKNFNFGNNYEESHGWAGTACVYNGESFAIPVGAMTSFLNAPPSPKISLPSADQSQWEWLGGDVSKSWGNEYGYSFGHSYEWNGGPQNYVDAWGNAGLPLRDTMQGKHCTFSYGTGYEEALIEWAPGDSWFHADDSGSPYAQRLHDEWQSANLSTWASSKNMISSWIGSNLLVSKDFGPNYEYHFGPTRSVLEGASEEYVYGPSWSTTVGDTTESTTGNSNSTVNGNSTENVTGNSTTTTTGDSNETVHGNATAHTYGNNTETHWGLKDEYFMGGSNEMKLAGSDEISLAATAELVAGLKAEVFLGGKFEFTAAAIIEIASDPKITMTPTELKVAIEAKINQAIFNAMFGDLTIIF